MSGSRKGSVETSSQSAHSGQSLGGVKVAIPRLRKEDGHGVGGGRGTNEKHRVSHACEPCRQRKTKCSGERPVCRHCEDFKITCYYGDGKRDRAKNELKSLQERVGQLEALLNQVSPQLDSAGQFAVTKMMQKSPSLPSAGAESSGSPSLAMPSASADLGVEGEKLASAEVGSTGSLDKLSEDVNTSTVNQASGYMGKNTDVSWLRRIEKQMDEEAPEDITSRSRMAAYSAERTDHHGNVQSIVGSGSTYQLDDLNLSMTLEGGDMFGLPSKHIADALLESFFSTIHTSFPFIAKPIFMRQYEAFMMNGSLPSSPRSWLAVLNIIFALGAIHSHLSHAEWRGDVKDHLQYLARARALYVDYGILFAIPDLLHVQALSMTGLYLAATNQPNRAWNVVGLAVRSAYSIGLHLYNDDSSISNAQKEVRVRVWYSLFILERLVAVMTGRPTAIHERYYSCPLPDANDDELVFGMQEQRGEVAQNMLSGPTDQSRRQSSSYMATPASSSTNPTSQSSYYFIERIKLSKVAIDVLNKLYCADTVKLRWNEVQDLIKSMDARLMSWLAELPSQLAFGNGKQTDYYHNSRLKNLLAFEFHNTRMLLHRPCLCRVDERIPKESEQSRSFNRHAAVTCVQAAQNTLAMLPHEPDPTWLMRTGPWWCILYYLVSAGVVIIIEIAYRAEHMPDQADGLASDAEKLLNWLKALSANNLAANRSYQALSKPLTDYLPRIGGSRKPWAFYRFADGGAEGASERPPKRRSSTYNESTMSENSSSSRSYFPPPREGLTRTTIPFSMATGDLFPLLSKTPYDETPPILQSSDESHNVMGQASTANMFPSAQQIKRFREWQDNLLQPNYDPSLVMDGETSGNAQVSGQNWWNFAAMDGSTEQGMADGHGSHSDPK